MLPGIGKGGHPVVEGMESNHWVALDIGKNGHAVFIAKTSNLRVADFFNSCYGASWQLVQILTAYIILFISRCDINTFFTPLLLLHLYASISLKYQLPPGNASSIWRLAHSNPPPPGQKSLSNAPPTIEWFFVLSMNVVELSKVTYWFLVLLLGFLLVSIVLWCRNFLSKPFYYQTRLLTLNSFIKRCALHRKVLTLLVEMSHLGKV